MECTVEKNMAACTCTYDCERRGKCCQCVAYHRAKKQLPGCFFTKEGERTYDRSIRRVPRRKPLAFARRHGAQAAAGLGVSGVETWYSAENKDRKGDIEEWPKNPVRITDLTLRDGHQSLFATRMTTADMLPIAAKLDDIGFYSMEVWGGATFDVTTRFLNEDPWDRVRILKEKMPKTPFQMLLRGQNLVGYRHYADDVVEAFVAKAAEVGIDIFRIFDALNDERNFITAYKAVKKAGKHIQGTLSYALTERRMGGPIFNLDYYVTKAKKLEEMGADSFCIKDMAGIISPYDAYELVSALKKTLKIPVHLHTHYTSGMASMACLKAIEAGADGIDTCVAPFALRSSHPAVEPFIVTLSGTDRDTGLDLEKVSRDQRLPGEHRREVHAVRRYDEVLRHRHRRAHAPDTGRHDQQPREPAQAGKGPPPHQRGVRRDTQDEGGNGLSRRSSRLRARSSGSRR